MNVTRIGTLIAFLAFCSAAHAQHTITYSQVSVAPGTIVAINGEDYVAVQFPVREFTQDKRVAARFLTPLFNGDTIAATLSAVHTTDPLPSTNATIDGFPALIEVSDGRNYSIFTDVFVGTNMMQVSGNASAVVLVDIGDTILTFAVHLEKVDHEVDLGLGEYRGTAQAAYGRYTDPVSLINVPGLDKWIDYIRVIPLN